MKNGILNELISTMKERIPQDMNLANTLADILCMGKEAVYRRLRGEVSFTIDEVALLSQKLGISIDQIVGSHVSNKVTFDLNLLHATSALESYYEIINRYLQIFDYVKTDNTTEVYTASNSLPFTLYSSYENLSKFRLCRWMYQNGDIKTPHSLEDMSVDERIVNVHKKLSESIRQCPKTFFIWDTNIFYSFVKEIKYFASLNLISQSAAGIFYQLDGFAKLIYLPDATQLDSIVKAPLYSGFGKWRSTAYCFLAKAVGSYQYVVNKGKHTKHCGF